MAGPTLSPRDAAVGILQTLRDAGHTAYLAGGCVRDALLGLDPKDYDVATDAHPPAVRRLFPRSRLVGEAFGVVLVRQGGRDVEVATFRTESGYADHRRPDRVAFTDAEHDARRRDFTINGLFADPLTRGPDGGDRVIDYVGGLADLEAGLIRAIGDPDARFAEDYLRMLRAARFAARLGFAVEPRTAAAIRPLAKYLGQISRERIGQEVRLMLTGPRPVTAAELVQKLVLDSATLGEDHADPPLPTLGALSVEHPGAGYATQLAAWVLDRHAPGAGDGGGATVASAARFAEHGSGAVVRRWRAALCLTNDDRAALHAVLGLVARAAGWDALGVAQRKRLLAEPAWPEAARLLSALDRDQTLWPRVALEAQPLLEQGVAPAPLVTGADLIDQGLDPGPAFRVLLESVYDAQLAGEVTRRDEALAWLRGRLGASPGGRPGPGEPGREPPA